MMTSDYPDPSFSGDFLPVERDVRGTSPGFGKVEGILIIPLEKWKFVHKLRWKKDVVCLIER